MLRGTMKATIGAALALSVMAGSLEAQMHDDPFVGAWKLNVERSVYNPGPRAPESMSMVYEFLPLPDGSTRFTLTATDRDVGNYAFQMSVFRIDGQRHPVYGLAQIQGLMTSNRQTNLTRSYRRIDATTVEFETFTDGVGSGPVIRELLPDGDTYVQRSADGEGNLLVFERVR